MNSPKMRKNQDLGIEQIISGGQTGADRAALDIAIELGIPHGGWCPKGRLAEDGTIDSHYNVKEISTPSYTARTEQNVIDSDGTLIFSFGPLTGGSVETLELACTHSKPVLHIDLSLVAQQEAVIQIVQWIQGHSIKVLNVAGPRDSKCSNIYESVKQVLTLLLK